MIISYKLPTHQIKVVSLVFLIVFALNACSTMYYATWEKLGKEKRDLLRDNVEAVKEDNIEAKEEFKDALTRLKELGKFDGGKLEKTYNALKDDYENCTDKAEQVHDRIEKVEDIASDLFAEWEQEIKLITNKRMRDDSAAKLKKSKEKYNGLHKAMKESEKRMDSVLVKFNDNVLYLKHNLNASAVGGLTAEFASIEKDVAKLIKGMEASIAKADEFIATLPQ